MHAKLATQRWGTRIGAALAGSAIVGSAALLAFASSDPTPGQKSVPAVSNPAAAIFVVNGDCNTITTYPAGANGDVPPLAPGAGLCSPAGIAVDAKGNVYVTNSNSTVTVYSAGSKGNVVPVATIGGSNTGLSYPTGIAVDGAGNIYVDEGLAVLVFSPGSDGNVAPSATITGSNT